MRVYGLWYGGNGYSEPDLDSLEEFPSIAFAEIAFKERFDSYGHYLCDTNYVTRENRPVYFPNVSEECRMQIFEYDPRESDGNPIPDRIITFGPRMGIQNRPVIA